MSEAVKRFSQQGPSVSPQKRWSNYATADPTEYQASSTTELNTSAPDSLTFKYRDEHGTEREKAPPYSSIHDQDYVPDTEIHLLYTAYLITLEGRNLGDLWKKIRERSAHAVREYDQERFIEPHSNDAIITKIHVTPLGEAPKLLERLVQTLNAIREARSQAA